VDEGCEQMHTASLVMWAGYTTLTAARRRVYGGSGASWVVGAGSGESRVVWDGSWIVVWDSGAGRVRPSSVRCVQMNTPARPLVTAFPGLWTMSVRRLWPGEPPLRCVQLSGC
jgi:hypothetical protein